MTLRLPNLLEYGSIDVDLTRRQAELLAGSGVVTVVPQNGGRWTVKANSRVGSLVVGDVELLIRPKIKPENLFLLLEVGLPEHAWHREAFDYATTFDLLPSVIAFFARTVETTLGRGLLRSYRSRCTDLVALRGRLDLPGQFRRTGVMTPVSCAFDEFTADNAENQYLRAGVRLALRVPRAHAVDRRRLMQQLVTLDAVSDVPVLADDLDRIVINRLNGHYEPALRLARLIIVSLTLVDQRGGTTASSFIVDMNDLFQRFVTERLRRALHGRLEVVSEPARYLAERRQVSMQPDLEFHRRGSPVFVGDVKYKVTADARARSGDYYQLLAYTTALDLTEGVLIYCLADGGTPERSSITVKHAGKVLHTYAIDLSGTPAAVASKINALAAWISTRATTAERELRSLRLAAS